MAVLTFCAFPEFDYSHWFVAKSNIKKNVIENIIAIPKYVEK